jgi:teichuronic acid biosynthesis glycosyltransferase TuaC
MLRALVVTNMYPGPRDRGRGSFVRDQVRALERLPGWEIELYSFESRGAGAYVRAARELRRRHRRDRFDVVHAHFGLTLWPALAVPATVHAVTLHGTDLVHPRSRAITIAGLPLMDLVAPVSEPLARLLPAHGIRGEVAVLPCGVSTDRFVPMQRAQARRALGLPESEPCLLFAADPARPEKRHDRAREIAGDVRLLTLGDVAPEDVPLHVNAANAVLVTSERESFGLAVLEALACDVPVLATPVGIAPEVLRGVPGTLCAPFQPSSWAAALAPLLADPDPRVAGRAVAEAYSADRMAARVADAWERCTAAAAIAPRERAGA